MNALDTKFAVKMLALFGAVGALFLQQRFFGFFEGVLTLPFFLFIENLLIANAIFPFGTYSVISAKAAIDTISILALALGYSAALLANVLSFEFGKLMSKVKSDPVQPVALIGTFWNPQFASICAFEQGYGNVKRIEYLRWALPISLSWYMIALFVIFYIPVKANSSWIPLSNVVLILGWIVFPIAKRVFFR